MLTIEQYIPIVEFLGAALGRNYEIVLHDLTKPEKSIVAIANGELSERSIGGPVTDFVLKVLKQGTIEHKPYLANYHAKNSKGTLSLSSSFFIHDESNKTIGVLCINHNISPYLAARNFLSNEIIHDEPETNVFSENCNMPNHAPACGSLNIFENFQGTVGDVIEALIKSALDKYSVAPERLSLDERLAIIKELNDNGLFLLKGGIPALAASLDISEPTVYRYLSKVKNENE
ncbi:MAG: PAS domain-containing protein [Acidaminococcaceae bacterium]|nr:PAS domain-containing protein [Acidaminococcaceae bacterium]MDD4721304.1 PAS domain-containing protein [Acidaminococcaceae bacterium]